MTDIFFSFIPAGLHSRNTTQVVAQLANSAGNTVAAAAADAKCNETDGQTVAVLRHVAEWDAVLGGSAGWIGETYYFQI